MAEIYQIRTPCAYRHRQRDRATFIAGYVLKPKLFSFRLRQVPS